jgi:hypothetical protein
LHKAFAHVYTCVYCAVGMRIEIESSPELDLFESPIQEIGSLINESVDPSESGTCKFNYNSICSISNLW